MSALRCLVLLVCCIACVAPTAAQPTFWSLEVQDGPPLELVPLGKDFGPSASVFVTRAALSPAARERLAAGLGYEHTSTLDPARIGPAILGRTPPGVIPGDPRLRIEHGEVTVSVLGIGATVEETLHAARAEPMPSCILIGAHHDAEPPAPWTRIGEPALRPVIWNRAVTVWVDRVEGSSRVLTIMDGPGPLEPRSERLEELLHRIRERGPFAYELWGVAMDDDGAVYWSWLDRLEKTSAKGDVLVTVTVAHPLGDLTWHGGHVVATTPWEAPKESAAESVAESAAKLGPVVYVFDDATLETVAQHRLTEARGRLGGVCWAEDRYVITSAADGELRSASGSTEVAHEYDAEFKWLRSTPLPTRGLDPIRTAEFAYGRFFFGCGGAKPCALIAAPDLRTLIRLDTPYAAHGIAKAIDGWLLFGVSWAKDGSYYGGVRVLPPSSLWR
jgi:hypothetical protein